MARPVKYTRTEIRMILRSILRNMTNAEIIAEWGRTFTRIPLTASRITYVREKFGRDPAYDAVLIHGFVPWSAEDDYGMEPEIEAPDAP